MHTLEPVKRLAERATGIGIPSRETALASVRRRAPQKLKFKDDGYIPNNKLPLLLYRKAIHFGKHDPAALLEAVFEANEWGECWRNGIYDYVHYHSRLHEVLGIAKGSAALRLGGNKGKTLKIRAGDVIIVPAGVGHECLAASKEFLVVGAYPPGGIYDECRGSFQERASARKTIAKVKTPKNDPLYGVDGGLTVSW